MPPQERTSRDGSVVFRLLAEEDSISELTQLIRRAYARLAEMGLRYVGTWQEDDITRRRVARGECWVGVQEGRLVASVVLCRRGEQQGPEWYRRPEVAMFQQFCVDPDLQGHGVGSEMLDLIEERARELGAEELALDTSEHSTHLIDYYARRGWRVVGEFDWDLTNYRSVVMSKALPPATQAGEVVKPV